VQQCTVNGCAASPRAATFDTCARLGWASSAWACKWVSDDGDPQLPNWGQVTNAEGARAPALDFRTAPLAEIEALVRLFGSLPEEPHSGVLKWMRSAQPPEPFVKQVLARLLPRVRRGAAACKVQPP
jgi:glucan 1,3-beta-glucosidase